MDNGSKTPYSFNIQAIFFCETSTAEMHVIFFLSLHLFFLLVFESKGEMWLMKHGLR